MIAPCRLRSPSIAGRSRRFDGDRRCTPFLRADRPFKWAIAGLSDIELRLIWALVWTP